MRARIGEHHRLSRRACGEATTSETVGFNGREEGIAAVAVPPSASWSVKMSGAMPAPRPLAARFCRMRK